MRSLKALLGISIALCGCGYLGSARSWDPASASEGFDLLGGLEPLLQRGEEDCGFAVLAMLLRHHGVGGGESLAAGGGALTARELRDELRSRGFRAYLIQGEIDDLAHEIRRGRPAIVGLVKPGGDRDRPHFEIVAGIHEAGGLIAGVDPARGWTLNSFTGFLKEWEPAGRLLLVAAP
ncbi:MAG: hypothetical protein HY293_07750, partial [Planctomycetes bacterium]|nr:hypothetical protein [Planctomycetota bacterium]